MTTSSSTSAVFLKFCLSWQIHGVTHSVWTGNLQNLLNIFFTVPSGYKGVKIDYFPEKGKSIRLFKRRKS